METVNTCLDRAEMLAQRFLDETPYGEIYDAFDRVQQVEAWMRKGGYHLDEVDLVADAVDMILDGTPS